MIRQNFSKKLSTSRRVRRGQALIEMAMVVTVLLFLTLGLIQYGLIANTKVTMANLARVGARRAAVIGLQKTSDDSGKTNKDSIRGYVFRAAASTILQDIDDSNVEITPATAAGRTKGDIVTVTIKYDMRRKIILPLGFPGLSTFNQTPQNTPTTQVSATMVLE